MPPVRNWAYRWDRDVVRLPVRLWRTVWAYYQDRPHPVRPAVRAFLNFDRISLPDIDVDFGMMTDAVKHCAG